MERRTFLDLDPGVYLAEVRGLMEPVLVLVTRRGAWDGEGMMINNPDRIGAIRPLERMGGLSGAMYWGDEIR
jgi:hypothetical protein